MPRTMIPFCMTISPDVLGRLKAFSEAIGRPQGWIVMDALTAYLDAVEKDGEALQSIRAKIKAPALKVQKHVPETKLGRPPAQTTLKKSGKRAKKDT